MKKIFILFSIITMIVLPCFAEDFEVQTQDILSMDKYTQTKYIQQIKTFIYGNDCKYKINTPEFKKIILEHKRDKNYPETYYASQSDYDYYNSLKLESYYTKYLNILYMYTIQEQENLRIIYYYNPVGKLVFVEFIYGNYPNYPFFTRKYSKKGTLIESTYAINETTKIKFNTKGTKACIIKDKTTIQSFKL